MQNEGEKVHDNTIFSPTLKLESNRFGPILSLDRVLAFFIECVINHIQIPKIQKALKNVKFNRQNKQFPA